MVQVSQDRMVVLRKALNNMEGQEIACGPVGAPEPNEVIKIKWIDDDKAINVG